MHRRPVGAVADNRLKPSGHARLVQLQWLSASNPASAPLVVLVNTVPWITEAPGIDQRRLGLLRR